MTRPLMPIAAFAAFAAAVAAGLAATAASASPGQPWPRLSMEILVDGRPLPQYPARGTRYVEALRGRDYAIRLTNPYPVRVAIALSVDGLNTIDARRTDPREARKWVLDPYETVTISGWQTSQREARRFVFTTEEGSYAARIGRGGNQGIISAVLFRERAVPIVPVVGGSSSAAPSRDQARASRPASPAPPAAEAGADTARLGRDERKAAGSASSLNAQASAEELAATGIGRRTEHLVRQVHLELEDTPSALVDLRYEYRAQLVELGVLPPVWGSADRPNPLDRREGAKGFAPGFCPIPK